MTRRDQRIVLVPEMASQPVATLSILPIRIRDWLAPFATEEGYEH